MYTHYVYKQEDSTIAIRFGAAASVVQQHIKCIIAMPIDIMEERGEYNSIEQPSKKKFTHTHTQKQMRVYALVCMCALEVAFKQQQTAISSCSRSSFLKITRRRNKNEQ